MKIEWHFEGVATSEVIDSHITYAKQQSKPAPKGTGKTRLLVLGGGPSAVSRIDEIKAFDGDIWIIGSAFQWARCQGIDGVYFNIDPSEDCALECVGAKQAIIASSINPSVFAALENADVSVFDLVENDSRLNHGVTTATAVPELAILCGYTYVVFYGCESSFDDKSHAYRNDMETNDQWMYVRSDGETFKTRPDYFAQAEFLATMIRAFPKHFKERSGGFLRAMVHTMEYDVTHMTQPMYQALKLS